ncbi:MAG: Gfo/Idh/MocA family oxidoreductase [Planctomycetales bacterium]|nr:Gfo/Idh/MocA family oxidoreductase [Planctomycetales bacterium]
MATYRVGIIGRTGKGDYGHGIDTAFMKVPNVEIVAVSDENSGGRAKAIERTGAKSAYASFRDMLATEKLDIVAICPRWIDQHHEMLLAAAEVGCHVYMEKPFCRTLTECDDVITQLQMRHLKLGIAHITQYSPVLDTVRSLVESGEIGTLLELRGRGKEDRRGGGEDLWVLGSHVFAMMRSIGGGQPTSCYATVTADGQPITRTDIVDGNEGLGLLAGDHIQATYQFPKGITGHFASRRSMAGSPSRFGLQIFGSKGMIEMTSGYGNPAYILQDGGWSPGRSGKQWKTITSAGIDNPEPRTDGNYEGGHVAAIKDLINAIEQQRETKCNAEDCRGIVEMTAAIYESARLQGPVELPLKTRANPLSLWESQKQ